MSSGGSHHDGIPSSLSFSSGDHYPEGNSLHHNQDGATSAPVSMSVRASLYRDPHGGDFGSPLDPKPPLFTDIFSDGLFSNPNSASSPIGDDFTPPHLSGSPELTVSDEISPQDAEELSKRDPLAAQVWKTYAKRKASMPQSQRMENLTWKMMALALKKKREEEGAPSVSHDDPPQLAAALAADVPAPTAGETSAAFGSRGRTMGKGKAKVTVVGFDDGKQDPVEEET
jgi:GATA-binding protein